MRRVILVLLAVGLMGGNASAQQSMSANERAYTLTIMCAAVAKHYGNNADHMRALDASNKMAKVLQYSFTRYTLDLEGADKVLAKQHRSDPGRITKRRELCRQLQLAS
jgi:hypothetical protein